MTQLQMDLEKNSQIRQDNHYYATYPSWYAVYTKSRAEKKVLAMLLQKKENDILKDVNLFLPVNLVKSKWSDRFKIVEKPLFPGYLFIHTRLSNYLWRELIITPGVANLLHKNNEPLEIPQRDIDVIHQMLDSKVPVAPFIMFKEGQKVIVKRGPFKGIEGILQKIDRKRYNLIVNFPLLRQAVKTTINVWDVEPL